MDIKKITENSRIFSEFLELEIVDKRAKSNPECIVPFSTIKEIEHSPDYHGGEYTELITQTHVRCSEMLYHESWDWLMVVVEHIEFLDATEDEREYYFQTDSASTHFKSKCLDTDPYKQYKSIIGQHLHEDKGSRFEATYKASLEFIKWYKENKK